MQPVCHELQQIAKGNHLLVGKRGKALLYHSCIEVSYPEPHIQADFPSCDPGKALPSANSAESELDHSKTIFSSHLIFFPTHLTTHEWTAFLLPRYLLPTVQYCMSDPAAAQCVAVCTTALPCSAPLLPPELSSPGLGGVDTIPIWYQGIVYICLSYTA